MPKSIRVNQKKRGPKKRGRGRPPRPGGRDPVVAVRLPPTIITEVDLVAEREGIGRSEAVRRLLEDAVARSSAEVERVAEALTRGDVEAAIKAGKAVPSAKRRRLKAKAPK
jgi:Ribbon-helix-helix protein, copG family